VTFQTENWRSISQVDVIEIRVIKTCGMNSLLFYEIRFLIHFLGNFCLPYALYITVHTSQNFRFLVLHIVCFEKERIRWSNLRRPPRHCQKILFTARGMSVLFQSPVKKRFPPNWFFVDKSVILSWLLAERRQVDQNRFLLTVRFIYFWSRWSTLV